MIDRDCYWCFQTMFDNLYHINIDITSLNRFMSVSTNLMESIMNVEYPLHLKPPSHAAQLISRYLAKGSLACLRKNLMVNIKY